MSWDTVKLEEICDVIRGVTYSSDQSFNDSSECEDLIPILRAGNIQNQLILDDKLVWVSKDLVKEQQIIKAEDILMCTSSGSSDLVGKNAIADQNWYGSYGAFCANLRNKNKDRLNSKFLYFYLNSDGFSNWTKKSSGANIKNIRISELRDFCAPLPPLHQQQRIADILDKAEAINQKREQALALCDEFLRATFLNMFGDPVSNPKGWKVDKLKNLTSINPKPDKSKLQNININEGVSFVPMAAVCEVDKKVTEYERRPLNEVIKGFTYFEKEDVILAKITPCFENGKMAHLNNLPTDIGYGSTEFHVFRVSNKTIMPEYLFNMLKLEYFLEMGAFKMRGAAGQRRVPIEFFGEFVMPIPPIELQQKFSEIVEKVNAIKAHIQHAQELPLFDALSQQAFKGELTQ